jgi:hypothetical protein
MFALDKLTIERFRGLRELDLNDLGRINLLVGQNNSGKTSVLEAISIFCRPLDPRAWLESTWSREVLDPGEPFFLLMEWVFPHWRHIDGPFVEGEVVISGTGRFSTRRLRAIYKPTSRIRTKPARTPGDPNGAGQAGYEQAGGRMELRATAEELDGTRDFPFAYDLWEGEPLAFYDQRLSRPVRTVTPVSQRVELIPRELSEATLAGHKRQILALLKEIDSRILDVLILFPRGKIPEIYIDYASSGLLPLSAFGDGVRRAFLIALFLNSVAGGVLLIDEIESSLHVTALGSLFSWLVKSCEELDVQLFATTHSLEAVDAMIEAESKNLDRIVGYHLEVPNGVPQVQRLDGHLLHRLRYERGLDVRL